MAKKTTKLNIETVTRIVLISGIAAFEIVPTLSPQSVDRCDKISGFPQMAAIVVADVEWGKASCQFVQEIGTIGSTICPVKFVLGI